MLENDLKNMFLSFKYMQKQARDFGPTQRAEVAIHGASSIHFGPLYKLLYLFSAHFTTEVFWAEMKTATKVLNS